MFLLALFTIKYNLPAEARGNLLSLISLALPAEHCLPKTLNRFKRYFRNLCNPLILHYYCSFCLTHIENKETTVCPNTGCLKDLTNKGTLSYHIEIPIVQQLQNFFRRAKFYDDIQYRLRRQKAAIDNIEDIYDGRVYKELCANGKGILSCRDNISFLMNTDGVPIFKSSKVSIWPLYLAINELPYSKRMARENMLFVCLWFGERKPAMWSFLKPHVQALQKLEEGGEFDSPERGTFFCKAILLACTCDLPARCLVCNGMQYNSENGCWKCLQAGKTVQAGNPGGHARAFPYEADDPKGPLRNKENIYQHAREAMQKQLAGKSRQVSSDLFSCTTVFQRCMACCQMNTMNTIFVLCVLFFYFYRIAFQNCI